jgi:hypothetical protein
MFIHRPPALRGLAALVLMLPWSWSAVRASETEPDDGSPGTRLPVDFSPALEATEAAIQKLLSTIRQPGATGTIDPPEQAPAAADSASPSPPPLSPELEALREKLRQTLSLYAPKHLNTRDHSSWEVMHWIIAYGTDAQLFRGGPSGPPVNAIGWSCYNGPCRGEQMLYLNNGKLAARRGPGVQGHDGQFLAILAQARVKRDYPMLVDGKTFAIADLVDYEKQGCLAGEELTFKLIGLMHYLQSDEDWTSKYGEKWTIQRLIQEELKQPIRGAACGGTHRLMGLSYAVNKRIKRGQPVVGEFRRAQIFINDYHRYTFSLQNPDGSFSTEWFTRRGANPDLDRRLKTTGHILEWLAFSLSDEELRSPAMLKSVHYLSGILLDNPQRPWEIGPRGHALHALALVQRRLFEPPVPAAAATIAERPEQTPQ